jgi:hypothetical protein
MSVVAVSAKVSFPAVQYSTLPNSKKFVHGHVLSMDELTKRTGHYTTWPKLRFWVPGGIYDCTGQHFVFRDVRNIPKMPFWLKPFDRLFGSGWFLKTWEADLVIDEPIQLSLEEFKIKLCALAGTTMVQGITRKKLKELIMSAQSYNEVIYVMCGADAFSQTNPPWHPPPESEIALYESKQTKGGTVQYQPPKPSSPKMPLLYFIVGTSLVLAMFYSVN